MKSTYHMLPSDYEETQVLFFLDKENEEWFVDERSVRCLSGLEENDFVKAMNRAEFRQTRKGRWLVSLLDAYLVLPEAPRNWMHKEQHEHLPLRLTSGKAHDAMLLSLEESARRFVQINALRASRGHDKQVNLKALRQRMELSIKRLSRYGVNEDNSAIIRSAISVLKVRNDNGTTAV